MLIKWCEYYTTFPILQYYFPVKATEGRKLISEDGHQKTNIIILFSVKKDVILFTEDSNRKITIIILFSAKKSIDLISHTSKIS